MKNVAVFFGGKSTEHDISIISATQVMKVLEGKVNVIPVYISKENDFFTGEMNDLSIFREFDESRFKRVAFVKNKMYVCKGNKAKYYQTIDVALPVLHGRNGEDGAIQGFFTMSEIPFAESGILSSGITLDKVFSKYILKQFDIPYIEYCVINRNVEYRIKDIENELGYPMIIKPANLGSSIGVTKVTNRNELIDAINLGFMFDEKILIEKCLEDFKEYNISVFGHNGMIETSLIEQPLSKQEILTFQDKYKTKGGKGMESLSRIFPAEISEELKKEIETYAIRAYREFELKGIVRIDFLYKDKLYLNEINSIPGSMAYYLWKDRYTFGELMTELINEAERDCDQKDRLMTYFNGTVL